MVPPSGMHQGQTIFLDAENHVLVDIHVPAFTNPHPDRISTLFQELAAQRNPDVTESNLQNHRLTKPHVKARLHCVPSQEGSCVRRVLGWGLRRNSTMVQRGYHASIFVL